MHHNVLLFNLFYRYGPKLEDHLKSLCEQSPETEQFSSEMAKTRSSLSERLLEALEGRFCSEDSNIINATRVSSFKSWPMFDAKESIKG